MICAIARRSYESTSAEKNRSCVGCAAFRTEKRGFDIELCRELGVATGRNCSGRGGEVVWVEKQYSIEELINLLL